MNFQDLLSKLKTLEETSTQECGDSPSMAGGDDLLVGEQGVEECGMGPEMNKQANNVSMNVSMNGSGAGGIKDLMNILKNIDQGGSDKDVIVGMDEENSDGDFSKATTSPEQEVADMSAMLRTGNDLSSKGAERPKVNGGGNPMQEALVQKLSAHYQRIKENS